MLRIAERIYHSKRIALLCLLVLAIHRPLFGDEQIRQVQEELRKRNLYFGDVDGRLSPDVANALKRYQARKGFAVTGTVDDVTATSLSIGTITVARSTETLPDVPVLKSDTARALEEAERAQLAKAAEESADLASTPVPPPPAEEPPPAQNLTPDRINQLVQQYLRDSESDDIAAQTRYFAYPVEYFVHGLKGQSFVEKDVTNYIKRWPERKYTLTKPVTFAASGADETVVQFQIAFSVRNKNHRATGRTNNTWTLRPEGDDLKIVSIHEERLRE
ncbi:MAG: peptidoglycan-binding protein [Chthoniobacterales bacterium]